MGLLKIDLRLAHCCADVVQRSGLRLPIRPIAGDRWGPYMIADYVLTLEVLVLPCLQCSEVYACK